MKILVTGGTGYIGSHTVVELQRQDFEVIIVDNLSNSNIEVLDGIEAITGVRPVFEKFDLSDTARTVSFFNDYKDIDAIIHFAAYKSVGESVENPLKYYHNNLESLKNVLQGMADHSITNLVFSSSCTVYGQPDTLPVREDSPLKKAVSPYGNTKKISEDMIVDFTRVRPVRSIMLRYFNPIGAHESAYIGELPSGIPNNLIPYITQVAIGKREFLSVWGDDYDTPDGTPVRDYIHVVDLARAHVVAVQRMLRNKCRENVEVFNLGTGQGNTVMEVIHSFERSTGIKLKYRVLGRRPGDVEKIWADTSLANRELGWKAEKSLEEMTLSAWRWEQALQERSKEK
jgi:UDP-glucose 4-epimerase